MIDYSLDKDDTLIDFISGISVKNKPEEKEAVQPFSRVLVDDYGYPKDNIQVHPQFYIKSRPSDKSESYPLDIAIFKGNKKTSDNLYIIVECKRNEEKEGLDQLEKYLALSNAQLGVWYNGKDAPVYLRKIIESSGIRFEILPNIPLYGENVEDLGKHRKKDLRKPHNLKTIFKMIRNHLAGNAVGTTRDEELATQLINIIFTKIYEERFKAPNDILDFRVGLKDKPEDVKCRISKLFDIVKTKYNAVISRDDSINLDDTSLVYVVGQLQNLCLIDAERDVIADAFETFIGTALKGPQGQFFTPRNVVKVMTTIMNQGVEECLIDPACGTGGFLVESLRSLWLKVEYEYKEKGWDDKAIIEEKIKIAMDLIRGIEKDSFLAKVAKAYMAILGDGKGNIFCEDSLNLPINWASSTQRGVPLNTFDCVLANPPFGKDIKVIGEKKLQQYELAYKWEKNTEKTNKLNKEMPPQVLFVERCLQLLKPGGRLGLIIPETYFHAPRSQYVMNFMAKHNITCLLDLPHNTFRPHNNAKCIAIFLEKDRPQQEKIMMCVAEEMGHDHQGKEIYRWDYKNKKSTNEIWDDLNIIQKEVMQYQSNPSSFTETTNVFFVDKADVIKSKVYVPRYYWKKKEEIIEEQAKELGFNLVRVSDLIDEGIISHFDGHGSPESENKGKGEVPYIRVKDIVNWDVYKDPTSLIPEHVYKSMFRKNKKLLQEDILYVRRGSYRIGSVAMLSPNDCEVLLTREILVLRIKDKNNKYYLTSFYLLFALSHWITQEQAKNKVLIETTLPNIADRWKELLIPIPSDPNKVLEISKTIENSIRKKWDSLNEIRIISEKYGPIIT